MSEAETKTERLMMPRRPSYPNERGKMKAVRQRPRGRSIQKKALSSGIKLTHAEIDYDDPVEEEEVGEENMTGTETEYLVITNLKRPFSTNELKDFVGSSDLWVNRNRSVAVAKYLAKSCRGKIDGVKWPSAASNALGATFVTEDVANEVKATGVFTPPEEENENVEKASEDGDDWILKHFRKTKTQPHLFWTPAPAEVVKEREAAAEAKDTTVADATVEISSS